MPQFYAKSGVVDAKRRLAKCRKHDCQKAQSTAALRSCKPCFMVPLEAHDAPERELARSALLPVVLGGMSAFDLLLAGSFGLATPSQTVNDTTFSKAEKRFVDISRRRATVLTDAKSTAYWWKYSDVGRKVYVDPDSERNNVLILFGL